MAEDTTAQGINHPTNTESPKNPYPDLENSIFWHLWLYIKDLVDAVNAQYLNSPKEFFSALSVYFGNIPDEFSQYFEEADPRLILTGGSNSNNEQSDTRPVSDTNDANESSSSKPTSDVTHIFYAVFLQIVIYLIENSYEDFMTLIEFTEPRQPPVYFEGINIAPDSGSYPMSTYQKGVQRGLNKVKRYYTAQSKQEIVIDCCPVELRISKSGKTNKYCPLDLFLAEWLYDKMPQYYEPGDKTSIENHKSEKDQIEHRDTLLYIFNLFYDNGSPYENRTIPTGSKEPEQKKEKLYRVEKGIDSYAKLFESINNESDKNFVYAFMSLYRFEMQHRFLSYILFADYCIENTQGNERNDDFVPNGVPEYAIKNYYLACCHFNPFKNIFFSSPFVIDSYKCMNMILNKSEEDYAVVNTLLYRYVCKTAYLQFHRVFADYKLKEKDYAFLHRVLSEWYLAKERLKVFADILKKIQKGQHNNRLFYNRLDKLSKECVERIKMTAPSEKFRDEYKNSIKSSDENSSKQKE